MRLSVADDFDEVIVTARAAFSKRSWPFLVATAVPWLLCAGQRSITRLASIAEHRRSLSSFYQFFSDGKWRLELLFRSLFELVVRTFHLEAITLALDDTLCPKWGHGIFGTGSFFDHTRRPRPGYIWGHNWIVLAVVVSFGGIGWVSLPIWVELYRPKTSCRRGEFRTRHQIAFRGLSFIRAWFSGEILLVADGAYATASLAKPLEILNIEMVSRLRSDARLREVSASRSSKKGRGRKSTRGPWLGKLVNLARHSTRFEPTTVRIYGRSVELEVLALTASWPAIERTIRVVITRDPRNHRRVTYLWSTKLQLSPVELIESFAKRWTIEQLFSVAKNQLGFDSAEVRRKRSVLRHGALCMAMVTWIEVWAYRHGGKPGRRSFAKNLATLREATLKQTIFASGPRSEGLRRFAHGLATVLTVTTQAA